MILRLLWGTVNGILISDWFWVAKIDTFWQQKFGYDFLQLNSKAFRMSATFIVLQLNFWFRWNVVWKASKNWVKFYRRQDNWQYKMFSNFFPSKTVDRQRFFWVETNSKMKRILVNSFQHLTVSDTIKIIDSTNSN